MNVFDIHRRVVRDYGRYIRSFINISDPKIARERVVQRYMRVKARPDSNAR